MKNVKKLLCLVLVVVMVMSMAGCNPETPSTSNPSASNKPSNGNTDTTKKGTYKVSVMSAGNMGVAGVDVQVFDGDNMLDVQSTDAEGKASFSLDVKDGYKVIIDAPDGYATETSYSFTGNTCNITITSAPIDDTAVPGTPYQPGDVTNDFQFTDVDGNTHKISQILAEKKVVILNLWYIGCYWCEEEFPMIDEGYKAFQDKVEILAINPSDTSNEILNYKNNFYGADEEGNPMGLSFPFASVSESWANMVTAGYPTTYVIDRYGVVVARIDGAIPSAYVLKALMEYYTAEDYQQKIANSMEDIVPEILPDVDDETPEDIAAVLGNGDGNIVYRNDEKDANPDEVDRIWPFIKAEKDGITVLKASNSYDNTYGILYLDVTMKKGQALAMDYWISSQEGSDVLQVIANNQAIYTISGLGSEWETCYPWVAPEDGTYEVGLVYIKDSSGAEGDDTCYIKNIRILEDSSMIDIPTYLPYEAATTKDELTYSYVDIVYNEEDGYYHVGTVDGPLLLANLMGYTVFDRDNYFYELGLDGKFIDPVTKHDYCEDLVQFAQYAANSKMSGFCTVNKELAELLQKCMEFVGFEGNDQEWLKLCKYYQAFCTDGKQMMDPIEGLATFSAPEAFEGVVNEIPYDGTPIMPRGKFMRFTPTKSGVYRVVSCDTKYEPVFLSGWIMDKDRNILVEHSADPNERTWMDPVNVNLILYMEAGTDYFINIAFWDMYTVGEVPFTIEYLGLSAEIFRPASPGPFTYRLGDDGSVYETIHGFNNAVLNPDTGYYHFDLGKDEEGNQIYGNVLYADFIGAMFFDRPIIGTNGLIDSNAFDFTQTAEDAEILFHLDKVGGDVEALKERLLGLWGEEYYEEYYNNVYMVDDVVAGKLHGQQMLQKVYGEDFVAKDETEAIMAYVDKMITTDEAHDGCVPVDEELARLLQLLMDKFGFPGVDQAWMKLCFYYEYNGPAK